MNNDWMCRSVCRSHPNRDLWFSRLKRDQEAAKAVCRSCPMLQECADWAAEKRVTDGVWAGQYIRKPAQSPRQWVHGTDAGWKRHRRLGERPCTSCVQGHLRSGQDRWTKR